MYELLNLCNAKDCHRTVNENNHTYARCALRTTKDNHNHHCLNGIIVEALCLFAYYCIHYNAICLHPWRAVWWRMLCLPERKRGSSVVFFLAVVFSQRGAPVWMWWLDRIASGKFIQVNYTFVITLACECYDTHSYLTHKFFCTINFPEHPHKNIFYSVAGEFQRQNELLRPLNIIIKQTICTNGGS